MEILFLIIGILLLIIGLAGCILPVLPGPIISFLALLVMQFGMNAPFTESFLIQWGLLTLAVMLLDYIIPAWGTKKFGGSKAGVWGSIIGLTIGLFAGPFGIITGPFLGALTGELITGKPLDRALKAAFGSFVGFLGGTLLKLTIAIVLAYYFIINITL